MFFPQVDRGFRLRRKCGAARVRRRCTEIVRGSDWEKRSERRFDLIQKEKAVFAGAYELRRRDTTERNTAERKRNPYV